jgi:hypothetical protein
VVARLNPFVRAFLAASVVHGAVVGVLVASLPVEEQAAARVEPPIAAVELIDIDVPFNGPVFNDVPTPGGLIQGKRATRQRPRPVAGRSAHPLRTEMPSAEDSVGPIGQMGSASASVNGASSSEESTADGPSLSREQLGLEGPHRLSVHTYEEAHSQTGRVSSAERIIQSMRQLALEHDRSVGLGGGGAVATALTTAAYRTGARLNGQATFEVVVIGNVVSTISLVTSDAGKQSLWNEVARTALAQLAGRHVRGPTGRRGVILRLQVSSRAALPSGHDPGLEISVGPFVLQRGSGKRSARLAFLEPDPTLTSATDLRGAGGATASGGGVSLFRTDIDPADLGANERQVVHSYTLDETPLD